MGGVSSKTPPPASTDVLSVLMSHRMAKRKTHLPMKNLRISGNRVISYTTHVATMDREHGVLYVHGTWSKTTSRHINDVARMYNMTKIDRRLENMSEGDSGASIAKSASLVAKLGNILCESTESRNAWKKRMLKAGIPMLNFPEDWDSLSETEKERRLNAVITLNTQES
jgi:hypothetical protein